MIASTEGSNNLATSSLHFGVNATHEVARTVHLPVKDELPTSDSYLGISVPKQAKVNKRFPLVVLEERLR